jgi:hypothetical protein
MLTCTCYFCEGLIARFSQWLSATLIKASDAEARQLPQLNPLSELLMRMTPLIL